MVKKLFILVLVSLFFVVGFVSGADCGGAVQCECGDTLIENHTMWYDLGGCTDIGLLIGVNGTILDCDDYSISGVGSINARGIYINNIEETIIKNCNVGGFDAGIYLSYSSNNNLVNNVITNNFLGISVYFSANNDLSYNTIENNINQGVALQHSPSNNIFNNTITNSDFGIEILGISTYNNIWNNFFVDNDMNAYDGYISNNWNVSEVGNYWDDFETNPGYPNYYDVFNHGIDWHPIWNFYAPVLDSIGDQTVNEGELLTIDVNAIDLDNDTLTYYTDAENILPSNFTFDEITGLFEWTPTDDDEGEYDVTFFVTDGLFVDFETITITVLDTPLEYYIDNSDSEFIVFSGDWNSRNLTNAQNGESLYNNPGYGNERVGWQVNELVEPGTYEIYVWKFEHEYSSSMATNTPYQIYHRTGMSYWIEVNQQTPGNEWILLGDYEFDNSRRLGVLMSDDADGRVIADAIKLVYTGPLSELDSGGPELFEIKEV